MCPELEAAHENSFSDNCNFIFFAVAKLIKYVENYIAAIFDSSYHHRVRKLHNSN